MYSLGNPSFSPLMSPVKAGGVIRHRLRERSWNRAGRGRRSRCSTVAASAHRLGQKQPIWSSEEA